MAETAIRMTGVSKRYRVGSMSTMFSYGRLTESLSRRLRHPMRRDQPPEAHIWALKDLDLEIPEGTATGFIGRNGAGKTTLLKVVSRITAPTEGEIRLHGRVGSLLEVGTGFHPELTGRENVALSGAILGMRRAEILRKFDEIVEFSGVEAFIDTPVKRYSSGMYVRLAFAVAAHLETEILVVDEVLSVGDLEFQRKCLGKMEDVAHAGRTVLFVSHQLGAITTLCDRAVWLDAGAVQMVGRPDEVVAAYVKAGVESAAVAEGPATEFADGHISMRRVAVVQGAEPAPSIDIRHPFSVEIDYEILDPVPGLRVGFRLTAADGTAIFMGIDRSGGSENEYVRGPGRYRSRCEIPGHLLNAGRFTISAFSDVPNRGVHVWIPDAVNFDVIRTGGISAGDVTPWEGFLLPNLEWEITTT